MRLRTANRAILFAYNFRHLLRGITMADLGYNISSKEDLQTVYKTIEDELKVVGQCSVTRKGNINLTPKARYNNILTKAEPIEGIIRQTRDGEYEVNLIYSTSATMSCWAAFFFGIWIFGLGIIFPIFPYFIARKKIAGDLQKALAMAEQQLDSGD